MSVKIEDVYEVLKKTSGKMYVSCSGEGDYPNISVREVLVLENDTFGYYDEDGTRTVELMRNRPHITLMVESEPFHGFKVKGKAKFGKTLDAGVKLSFSDRQKTFNNPVAVVIEPEEIFPY